MHRGRGLTKVSRIQGTAYTDAGLAHEYVDYEYDGTGQLTVAAGKESGGTTNRLHERFGYRYDAVGNLTHRTNDALLQAFAYNAVNRLTAHARSGKLTVAGYTTAPATNVTVNTSNAVRYADSTFASGNHTLVSGTNTFTVIAQDANRTDTNVVKAYLPTAGVFVHDANGNLRFDGTQAYGYDDENQLIEVMITNQWKSTFSYDGGMRRRTRKEYAWRNGQWALTNEVRYIYDGTVVIQERDQNGGSQITYTRGNDLSGSREGAGGVGGLLARTDNILLIRGVSEAHAYYHANANGDVTFLIDGDGRGVAAYGYDPFGNILSKSGPLAEGNLYRFSSKEWHANSALAGYEFRFYVPRLQRWLTRDPIEEEDGINQYSFLANSPLNRVDPYGLAKWSPMDDFYPDASGHNVDKNGRPLDPHVDRVCKKGGERCSYNLDGTPRDKAPPLNKKTLPKFQKAAAKVFKILKGLGNGLDKALSLPLMILDPCLSNPYFPGCGGGEGHCA